MDGRGACIWELGNDVLHFVLHALESIGVLEETHPYG